MLSWLLLEASKDQIVSTEEVVCNVPRVEVCRAEGKTGLMKNGVGNKTYILQ